MRTILPLLLAVCLLTSGCTSLGLDNRDKEDTTPILPGDAGEKEIKTFMIYYQLPGEKYLIGQQRPISIPENKRVEEILVQQIIRGPSSAYAKLVINPNTRVLSVDSNNDLIFVTLSEHFFIPLEGVPEDWENDEKWLQEVMQQRRMAVYAIVNTLTETGFYSRVLINVDSDGDGQGQRVIRRDMGFSDDQDQLLEALGRSSEMLFSPSNAVSIIVDAISAKDWEKVDNYVVSDAAGIQPKPDSDTFVSQLAILDLSVLEHTVHSASISEDGQSAVVSLDYSVRAKDGHTVTNPNAAISLSRSDGLWRMTYASMKQILNAVTGE